MWTGGGRPQQERCGATTERLRALKAPFSTDQPGLWVVRASSLPSCPSARAFAIFASQWRIRSACTP